MIRVRQVEVNVDYASDISIKSSIAKKLNISTNDIKSFKINKESIDARHKPLLNYIYEVDCDILDEDKILKRFSKSNDVLKTPYEEYSFKPSGNNLLTNRPIIVGSGPAGLFCAYLLSKEGYKPIILERGEQVEDRIKTVNEFWDKGILKTNSNVQFGEGGAGTFSDGKLNTLVKDKECRSKFVLETFVRHGANPNILYVNKPHIGTDVLVDVVRNMRNEIISMGGEFRYNSTMTKVLISDNKVCGVIVNDSEEIKCDVLVLAIGHSARDTFKMLIDNNILLEPKPFAIGVRIQHNQDIINLSQYGVKKHSILGASSYKLTHHASNGRGVYTFCMCPGGYVVNSSSEDNRLAINGMSYSKRDSNNANSAILVTIGPNDYGHDPMDGINFQRELEEKAFNLGKGNIPVQLFKDFKDNKVSDSFKSIEPIFKGNTNFSNINDILPSYINEALIEGIEAFGKKIKGFNDDDAILAAVESRTSSPVRMTRDDNGEANILGIYPCGEGAGYAGGITSAAMDGIKVYEFIASKYKNLNN